MAEQTLGDRDERLAANFDGTEFTECFPTSQGVSFRSKLGTAASRDVTESATDKGTGKLIKRGDFLDVSARYQNPIESLDVEQDAVFASSGFYQFGSLLGTAKWFGGVLAPNGKIYGIPRNSTQVLEIDPETQTTTLFGSLSGTSKWIGGVLAPNGKIYGIPHNSTQVLEIDPETQETTLFGSLPGSTKWIGGVLAPNGKIYGIPFASTQVLQIALGKNGQNWWSLSAYVNKL